MHKYYPSLCSGSSEEQIGPSEATSIHVFTVLCWEAGQGLNHVSISIEFMQTQVPIMQLISEEGVVAANSNSDQNHRPLLLAASDNPHCEQ